MKIIAYILLAVGTGFAVARIVAPETKIETLTVERIVRDTIIPPPIVKYLTTTKTVVLRDSILWPVMQEPQPAGVADDSVEVYKAFDTYTRGLDTVYVGTIFYGKPLEQFRQEVQFNPDHRVERIQYVYSDMRRKWFEFKPFAGVGIDYRGRPTISIGYGVTLNITR